MDRLAFSWMGKAVTGIFLFDWGIVEGQKFPPAQSFIAAFSLRGMAIMFNLVADWGTIKACMWLLFEGGWVFLLLPELFALMSWKKMWWCILIKEHLQQQLGCISSGECCVGGSIKIRVVIIFWCGGVVVVELIINVDQEIALRCFSCRIDLCPQIKLNPSASLRFQSFL